MVDAVREGVERARECEGAGLFGVELARKVRREFLLLKCILKTRIRTTLRILNPKIRAN